MIPSIEPTDAQIFVLLSDGLPGFSLAVALLNPGRSGGGGGGEKVKKSTEPIKYSSETSNYERIDEKSLTFPSVLTLESIENLPLMISAFITDSDGCSPLRLLPSKGSRPFNSANSTTPKDHTSNGGPVP